MLSKIEKTILIRALDIRKKQGEDPKTAIQDYKKQTDNEKDEILALMGGN